MVCLGGCSPLFDDARTGWLVDVLVDDNLRWMSRDHELLRRKYAEMAEDPYDFVRGTAAVYWADRSRTADRPGTSFLRSPEASEILIPGDPHPENVGTMLPGDGPEPLEPEAVALVAEINDLDAAAYGPYVGDLGRAMLGLGALLDGAGCDASCREPLLEAEAEAWFDTIDAANQGVRWSATVIPDLNAVTDKLLNDVVDDGIDREVLDHVTVGTGAGRAFVLDAALDDDGNGVLPLLPAEEAQVWRLVERYPFPPGARVFDVARRFGVGIASIPAVRYVIAWDRGSDAPDDDELLQLREVVDPPGLPLPPGRRPVTFDDNGARIVTASRTLWSRPDADARLAAVSDGATTFKALTWSAFDRSLDHGGIQADILDEDIDEDDLAAFATWLGAQLGAVHARSITAAGNPALPVIVADLQGEREDFVDERVRDAERDLEVALADHGRFLAALDRLGPLLGAGDLGL